MATKKKSKKKVAKQTNVNNMSAAELRAMANKIEANEAAEKAVVAKAEISQLREKRRELVAKHNKALAVLDRKINKLGGKSSTKSTRKPGGKSASSAVVTFVGSAGEASTKEIKAALDKQGVSTANLNQTLAYLKRQGKITSPSRAMYTLK